jgi:hypothetical protein
MTDAPGRNGVLLFGGFAGPGCCEQNDMWAFHPRDEWTNLTGEPFPGQGFGFAFDSGSDRAVLVEVSGKTWAYDIATGAWDEATPVGPTPWGSAMAYDAQSDRMILFGEDQTWAYDAEADTWGLMEPKRTPPFREFSKLAYDAGSDRVIVFGGGARAPGEPLGDTWAYDYDTDTWTEMSPRVSPPARTYSAMAYDAETDRVLLFGGSVDEETAEFGDTWAYDYDKDAWEQIEADGPGVRAWHVMTADEETGQIVLFGGGATRDDYTDEVWIFDPAVEAWSQAS